MPYYVFRITQATQLVKNLDLQESFEEYKEARNYAREQRAQQVADDKAIIKLVFAASQLEAEEHLLEQREKPILMEWEK